MNFMDKCRKYMEAEKKVYIVIVKDANNPWPYIDNDGYINVYTNIFDARMESSKTGFLMQELPGIVFCDIMEQWMAYGFNNIMFHKEGENIKISKGLFEDEKETSGPDDMFNSRLQFLMIHFMQANQNKKKDDENKELVLGLFEELKETIKKTIFFVPFTYDDEDLSKDNNSDYRSEEDAYIHLYEGAKERLSMLAKKGIHIEFDEYTYVTEPTNRMMVAKDIHNPSLDEIWLPAYTDIREILSFWKDRARVAVATYDDLIKMYKPAKGIVINPCGACFMISENIMKNM